MNLSLEGLPRKSPKSHFVLIWCVFVALALFVVNNSYFIVDPADMAATRFMGGTPMDTAPLGAGFHLKWPFMETVDVLQTSRSLYTIPDMDIHTIDNQDVRLSISVLYQIPPASVLPLLYNTGAAGNLDIASTITSTIRSETLITFASYNTTELSGMLGEISAKLQRAIGTALMDKYGIDVVQVNLGQITYSQAFTNAVEKAVQSKALAIAAQNTVLQKTYEGQQRVVSAEADAQAAVTAASASSRAAVINAEAQAKSIALIGQALLSNPAYVHYLEVTKWDGALPRVTGGTSPLISLDGTAVPGTK